MVERDAWGRYRQTEQAVVERFLDLIASGWGVYAAAREVGISGSKARATIQRSGLIAAYDVALHRQREALRSSTDPRLDCDCGGRKLIGHVLCPSCRARKTAPQRGPRRTKRALGYAVTQRDCCGPPPHRRCEPRDCDDAEQEYADYCGALIGPQHIVKAQDATGRCEECVHASQRRARKIAS